jgi:putative acetyltransferase
MIRPEQPADADAIDQVHLSAFASYPGNGRIEADLVRLLRVNESWIPELSLVAAVDGTVVGHALLTRATIGSEPALALGPIGVQRHVQRSGIGAELMNHAVAQAKSMGASVIVLLGDPEYYSRFGFVMAAELGIRPDVSEWASHFQALALTDSVPTGEFHYPQPFYELD